MDSVISNLHNYGYVVLFLYSLGGGQLALIVAALASCGIIAGLNIHIIPSILIALAGNAIGTNGLFLLAKIYKKDFAPYIKKHRRKLALGKVLLGRYGLWLILSHKYIYGLKSIIPMVAGMAGYSVWRFMTLNTIATVIWSLVVGLVFYKLGGVFELELIRAKLEMLSDPYILIPVLCIVLVLGYIYLSYATRRPRAKRK